jgi:S1-C subfamily serine protease
VVQNADEVEVHFQSGLKVYGQVIGEDLDSDLAVIQVDVDPEELNPLALADSNQVRVGQSVVAIGNPFGLSGTMTSGIVSALGRTLQSIRQTETGAFFSAGDLIQTDATINPGNSGGPLVNMDSQVVGINTAMIMGAQNIGFAIPINYAKKDLQEVKTYGKIKVPFLGVKYVLISKQLAEANKLPVNDGAIVVREQLGESPVIKGSAADKAGIKEWDIILECNGQKITAKNPLANILAKCKIGQQTTFAVLRDGKKLDLKANLKEKS